MNIVVPVADAGREYRPLIRENRLFIRLWVVGEVEGCSVDTFLPPLILSMFVNSQSFKLTFRTSDRPENALNSNPWKLSLIAPTWV